MNIRRHYFEAVRIALSRNPVVALRGPQTPGELRQRTERTPFFADTAAVETKLDELTTLKEAFEIFQKQFD